MGEPTALSDDDDPDNSVEHVRRPRSRSPLRIVAVNLANRARRRLARHAARACLPTDDGLDLVDDLIDVDALPNAPRHSHAPIVSRHRVAAFARPSQRRRRTAVGVGAAERSQGVAPTGTIEVEAETASSHSASSQPSRQDEPQPSDGAESTQNWASEWDEWEETIEQGWTDEWPGESDASNWMSDWTTTPLSTASSSSSTPAAASHDNGGIERRSPVTFTSFSIAPPLPLPPPPMSRSPPSPPESPPPALEREPDRIPWAMQPVPRTLAMGMQPVFPQLVGEASPFVPSDASFRSLPWELQHLVPPPPPPLAPSPRWPPWAPSTFHNQAMNPHHDYPAMALAAFSARQTESSWLPSFYVEVVQNGMHGQCSGCGETFVVGQLILGYLFQCDGWQRWVHAPRCISRVGFTLRPDRHTTVSFNPHTPPWERSRIVEELLLRPVQPQLSRSQYEVRPWLYNGAQARAHIQLIRPAVPQPIEAQADHGLAQVDSFSASFRGLLASRWLHTGIPRSPQTPVIGRFIPQTPTIVPQTPPRPSLESLLEFVPVQRLAKREAEPCVVCQEPMLPKESVRRLPCFHVFHLGCIDRWLAVKATCPLDNMCLQEMLEKQHSLNSE